MLVIAGMMWCASLNADCKQKKLSPGVFFFVQTFTEDVGNACLYQTPVELIVLFSQRILHSHLKFCQNVYMYVVNDKCCKRHAKQL